MRRPPTPEQIQALTNLTHHLRPHQPNWTTQNILETLRTHHHQIPTFHELTHALTQAALDPTTTHPNRIFHTHQHWPPKTQPNLPPQTPCPHHPWENKHHCRNCIADQKTHTPPPPPGKPTPPPPNWKTWKNTPPKPKPTTRQPSPYN